MEEGTCSSRWFFISNVDFCQKYLNSTIAYASLLTLTPESIVVECYYFLNNLFLYFLLGQSVLIYRLYFLKPSTSLLFTLLTLLNIRLFGAATDARWTLKKPQHNVRKIMQDNSLEKSLGSFTFTFAIRLVPCNLRNEYMKYDKCKISSAI